nr:type II toxin-antitoxin system RelE/ParE family toxin [Bacteroidota bacterium]
MEVLQSGIFKRKVKKLNKRQKLQLDEAIRIIIENPEIGEAKTGDLQYVFVYKFKIDQTPYLLAYRFSEEKLELIMLGPHENCYRDLKQYLNK